jgi:phasin
MANQQPFDVPEQLRDMAERNVEQGRAAYAQFLDAMARAASMWWGGLPANEMSSGFRVVQERSIRFAKQNAEACFALSSELAKAKDVQDVLAIQSRYAQTQMQAYALQAQELGRLLVEAAQGSLPRN